MTLTFGSLFSGIGGFDLGFERAGMVCRWQVEIDKHCNTVLAHHWPDVTRYEDVNHVGSENLEPVDVVAGGFPCQDLSVAGKREGLAGERSGLWFEFHRVLAELKPRWAVIENVPGLLSSNGGRDFAAVLRGLVELGYGVCWRVFDAQYDGVAQRRRRVFLVGSLGNGRAAEVLFESGGSAWDSAPSRETGARLATDVAASLKGSSGERGWPIDYEAGLATFCNAFNGYTGGPDDNDAQGRHLVAYGGNNTTGAIDLATACNAHGGTGRIDFESETFIAFDTTQVTSPGNYSEPKAGDPCHPLAETAHPPAIAFCGMSQSGWAPPSIPSSEEMALPLDTTRIQAVAFDWRAGDDSKWHTGPDGRHKGGGAKEIVRQGDYTGALNAGRQDAIAFTERTRSDGRNLETQDELAYALTNPSSGGRPHSRHIAGGFGVRRLTPRECERLQGFPDDFTLINGMSDSARYRMLGNAVAVPVVEWLGHQIVTVHALHKTD